MIDVLLVGSRASWRESLDPILLAHGLRVRWWWENKGQLGQIPSEAAAVVVMTDCNSHAVSKPAMDRARSSGIPLVCANHRKSSLIPQLERAGFSAISPPLTPEVEMSVNTQTQAQIYERVFPFLLDEPFLSNRELAERTGIAQGSLGGAAALARRELRAKQLAEAPEAEAEAEAPEAPAPAPEAPAPSIGKETKECVEALNFLIDAMRAEGVVRVVVLADGTVTMERRVTVIDSLRL